MKATRIKPTAQQRWWYVGIAAFCVVVAGLVGWFAAIETRKPADEQPRARQYLDYTACLLTGERGLADPAVAPVWAGMQDASLTTHAKVEYLAIAGPQTADNAATFLNTLAQTGCQMIFSVGDLPNATLAAGAARFTGISFHPVTSATGGDDQASPGPSAATGGVGVGVGATIEPITGDTPEQIQAAVAAALTAAIPATATPSP